MTATIEEMKLLFKDNPDYLAYCRNSDSDTKDMMIQELGREEHTHREYRTGQYFWVSSNGLYGRCAKSDLTDDDAIPVKIVIESDIIRLIKGIG